MMDSAPDDSSVSDMQELGARNTVDVYVPYVRPSSPHSACETWLERGLYNAGQQGFERGFLQHVLPPRLL
jgi:hypothetical protein